MLLPRAFRWYQCAFAAFILIQGHAAAVVLDWDSVAWASGSLSNTYQPDAADPESRITVAVTSNNGGPLVPYATAPNPMTPTVNAVFQGGLPTIENTLTIAVDLNNPSQSVTVNISFGSSGGASNVAFQIFDIDAGGPSQDQLSLIRGLSIDGITLIAPTITTNADNTLIGTGINQSVLGTATAASTGPTSGRGNVSISFGNNILQSLTFTFGSTAAFPDPAYQHFGLHDISFTPVPEVNPTLISLVSCLTAGGLVLRRRAMSKKSRE